MNVGGDTSVTDALRQAVERATHHALNSPRDDARIGHGDGSAGPAEWADHVAARCQLERLQGLPGRAAAAAASEGDDMPPRVWARWADDVADMVARLSHGEPLTEDQMCRANAIHRSISE